MLRMSNTKQAKPLFDEPFDDSPDALFGSQHFETLETTIEFTNATTKMPVKNNPKPEITEFIDQGLLVEMAQKSCSEGHTLIMNLEIKIPKKVDKVVFTGTAKVIGVEHEKDTDRIALEFVQYDEVLWEKVMATFNSRQDEIENFLKSARGY